MSNTLWKPMPGCPGFEINRAGWVRSVPRYVVSSGNAVALHVGDERVQFSREQLADIVAKVFGAPDEPDVAKPVFVVKTRKPPAQPHSTRERERDWLNPKNKLPLSDPWAQGTIETESAWDLAGVM